MNNSIFRKLNRKGQSIVELTLMTPLLLVALYIPIDFGMAYLTAHLTQNAVREAARIGASSKSFASATIRTEALNRMPLRLAPRDATATLFTTGSAGCAQFVEVIGTGEYSYFFYKVLRMFGGNVPDSRTITRTSRMRYEFQPVTNSTPCTS
jgi:Flp pilus assembly protein TadG